MNFIPEVGLGTFRLKGKAVQDAVRTGIALGYRHIDTAAIYKNEADIGHVLQELYASDQPNISRSDLWITSKLSPYDMRKPREALLKSLQDLQTKYLDLYLIHWPALSRKPSTSPIHKRLRLEAWDVLSKAKAEGLVRHIGVSNFTPQHIRELAETAYGIEGIFIQMEIHPWYWRDAVEIDTLFSNHHVTMVGYALFAEGKLLADDCPKLFDEIAAKNHATRAQVTLAWALAKKWVVLARSENEMHLRENLASLNLQGRLTSEDCSAIDSVNKADTEEKQCWDPRLVL